jgi:malate dehydrogenase (oxaloacetate-decarboxylating)
MATTITDEMCIAAAYALAKCAEDKGLKPDYILPTMDERDIFPREAVAVALKAIEQKVARIKLTKEQLFEKASAIINHARAETQLLMQHGLIPECTL